jgi:hypothetical protein
MAIISVKVLTEIPPAQAVSVRLRAIGVVSRRFRTQADCLVDEEIDRKRLEPKALLERTFRVSDPGRYKAQKTDGPGKVITPGGETQIAAVTSPMAGRSTSPELYRPGRSIAPK